MSDTERNPRKRPRLETESQSKPEEPENLTVIGKPCQTEEQPKVIYDPHYNAPDGDICIIRVEDTHFKIHRYLLSRDSLVFRDMLSLPQAGEPQGANEAAPIVLHDTVEEFRILCWALYALPMELSAQLKPDADVRSLAVLINIANKYQFLSIEDWASTTIVHHCRQYKFIDNLPLDKTPIYLKAVSRSSSKEFRDIVEDSIIKKFDKANLNSDNILTPLEEYGSPRLKGMLHYRILMLQESRPPKAQPNTSVVHRAFGCNPNSTRAYTAYRGFFSLTKWWEHFLDTEGVATALPCAPTCRQQVHPRCQGVWPNRFKCLITEIDKIRPRIDILAKLAELQRMTSPSTPQDANTFSDYYDRSTPCVSQWAMHIGDLRQRLLDTMGDHFYGPQPSQASH